MKIPYLYFVNIDLGQIKIQQDLEICIQLLATDRQNKKRFVENDYGFLSGKQRHQKTMEKWV
ncbi:MAG: hypothetical protein ACTS8R_03125 [Arsenophonus sp. NC-QC1-MAG3]